MCGKCSEGKECNRVNGSCLNGCDVGVHGDKCNRGTLCNVTLCSFLYNGKNCCYQIQK